MILLKHGMFLKITGIFQCMRQTVYLSGEAYLPLNPRKELSSLKAINSKLFLKLLFIVVYLEINVTFTAIPGFA